MVQSVMMTQSITEADSEASISTCSDDSDSDRTDDIHSHTVTSPTTSISRVPPPDSGTISVLSRE